MIALIFLSLFFLLILSVPMFVSVATVPFVYYKFFTDLSLSILPQRMFSGIDSFPLMAIPLFIFAANIMAEGGLSERLINFVNSIVGHIHGGLAICTVLACGLFGAITGSSAATVIAVGSLLYPALIKAGYEKGFSLGLVTCSALMGMIVPPSNAMIVYGSITGVSVGALFLSGIGASLVFIIIYSTYCHFHARIKKIPLAARISFYGVLKAAKGALWGLGMPIIIIGGIYSGIFTPTESAAVAATYAAFVCLIVYRMKLKDYWQIALSSAITTARVLIMVAAASLFSWLLTREGVTSQLVAPIAQAQLPHWMILAFSNVILLSAGMFVDVFSNLLIVVPILLIPITSVGISPLHFGIVATVNADMGNITPPFGLNIFVASGAFGKSYFEVLKAILPWLFLALIALIIITYIPEISMLLPKIMYPGIK